MLLQDVFKEFVFECEIRELSKRTIKVYRNNNALFFTFIEREFSITDLEKITTAHIKGYIQWEDYGRPKAIDYKVFENEYNKVVSGELKPFECMKKLGLTKPTFYRYKKQYESKQEQGQ